ncbi:MAG: DUF1538 domain-containing protein [Clostridia bacterium]|nr:DUF1538 domain-containing protein [Clostridia bacterium]
MNILKKIRDVSVSIIPIVAIALLLYFLVPGIPSNILIKFLIASALIIIGETLFLTGVDSTIMPMGEMVGSSIQKVNSFFLFTFFAFLFGMFATVAEPDVQVLTGEIVAFGMNINQTLLLFIIGAGVGLFVAFALIRIVKKVPIRVLYLVFMVIAFAVASSVPESFVAIAFDAGGSTVGIVTTPFLLAMVSGIVESRSKNTSDNFGVVGIAGLGPVIAVLILSIFLRGNSNTIASANWNIFVQVLYNTTMAIIPLVAVFYIFQIIYVKLPKSKKIALAIGVAITFVGLYLFLFGINFGVLEMGSSIGLALSDQPLWLVLIIYALFAFSIVFTEPAIRVLGAQIESETQGNINRKIITISMGISMVIAVVLSALRIYFNISIWYFIGIGYGTIAVLMLFSDLMFVSIGFDSGSVAGGPITTAIIMPAMVAMSSTGDGFGFIALTSMFPVLVLEIIGVVYNIHLKRIARDRRKISARVAYAAENYSNMEKLEKRYLELKERKENVQAE